MSSIQTIRLLLLQLIVTAACATTTASAVEVLPLDIVPNSYPDPSSVLATIDGGGLVGSDSDSSALSGEGNLELGLAGAPFESARVTDLSVVLDDGGSFSLLGGLMQATAEPGMTRVTMAEAGAAGTVTDGRFDQLGNLFLFEGEIMLNDEPLDLSTLDPVEADLEGIQLTDNGPQIDVSLTFELNFEGSISLDPLPAEVPLFIDISGSVLSIATKPVAPGDLDGNGLLDAADIDLLSRAIREDNSDPIYDLNQDQLVNQADRVMWVEQLKHTYFGDANLDAEFNTTDFIQVFALGLYEDGVSDNAGWNEGDWDGNGDFESGDFVAAFQAAGYEKGPRPIPQAVPEPSAVTISLVALMAVLGRRMRVRGAMEKSLPQRRRVAAEYSREC